MKRNLFFMLFFMIAFVPAIPGTSQKEQKKNKSEVEVLLNKISRMKSNEINYTYVSSSMIGKMLNATGIDIPLIEEIVTSLKNVRNISTNGRQGYKIVMDAIKPFLQEDDEVMGLELISYSCDGKTTTTLYGGDEQLLVIDYDSGTSVSITLFSGDFYKLYLKLIDSGIKIEL